MILKKIKLSLLYIVELYYVFFAYHNWSISIDRLMSGGNGMHLFFTTIADMFGVIIVVFLIERMEDEINRPHFIDTKRIISYN
jgi:uncharacterized membrane protein